VAAIALLAHVHDLLPPGSKLRESLVPTSDHAFEYRLFVDPDNANLPME
jgi:hypothetical protein